MGLDISSLITTLQAQNAIQPSGTVDAGAEKIAIRVSGQFTSEENLNAINFRAVRLQMLCESLEVFAKGGSGSVSV
jgi:multidrug efflux pump subunit AcrB